MSNYSDTIRRWVADDRHAGTLPNADGTGEVGLDAAEAGRRLAVRFLLRVDAGRATAVRYQVFGCGFTIAACAAAADLAEGRTLVEITAISPAAIEAALDGLPRERDYCASLAAEALQAAVKSAVTTRRPVAASIAADADHAPRITAGHPLYRLLIDSPAPRGAPPEDRHLFACLLAGATDTADSGADSGLDTHELADLLHLYFPEIDRGQIAWGHSLEGSVPNSPSDPELLGLLLAYLPRDADGRTPVPSLWLARALAARATLPGHLWRAMGLFSRPELTAAIRRHLPALAAANAQGMRWKRFLYKQLCERNGGMMCKAPECGACSDYAQCFAIER